MDSESIRSELTFRFSRSSGPGGQHAQKSSTRVEALYDVETSAGLSEPERRRVLAKLGPLVRAIAQDERSQLRNRELATSGSSTRSPRLHARGERDGRPPRRPDPASGASTTSAASPS